MKNVFKINADIKRGGMATTPMITQNDAVRFVISVYDGKVALNLSAVKTMTLASVRSDKETVVVPGEQTGTNTVSFDIGTSETALTGEVSAIVQLYDANGRVSTVRFTYKVLPDPTGKGFIPSEREKTIIEVVLGDGPLVIENATKAAADAKTATAYIDGKKPLIDKFTNEQTGLQAQINQVAIGATNAETSQARVDAKGTSHTTLKARLDKEVNEVNSSLVEEANLRKAVDDKAFYSGLQLNRNVKAILTFIDDDIDAAVWTQLKPVVEQEKVPITLAAITNQVGNAGRLTLSQMKQLQSIGFEMASHTHNHINLANSTPEVQREEMRLSKKWLRDNGFESDAIVYPFGSRDSVTQSIARQYFQAGVYIDNGQKLNATPITTFDLQRVYINAVGEMRVQLVKDKIDEAIATNSWIIVGLHCHYAGFSPQGMIDVIQYAKSKGVEIVSMKRGMELYSNIIDLPDFKIDALGRLAVDRFSRYVWLDESTSYANDTPIASYPRGTSVRFFNSTENAVAGFANSGQGVLYTHRSHDNRESYQDFLYLVNNKTMRRSLIGDGTGGWGPWQYDSVAAISHNRSLTVGDVPANSCKKITINSATYSPDTDLSWRMISSLPLGITVSFGTTGTATGEFIFCNVTGTSIDCGTQIMRITNFTRTFS